VTHKPAIEEGHLRHLKPCGVFSFSSPLSLLRNVWFHIVLFFRRRGREGQRTLNTNSFESGIDAARRKYATMVHDEASKSHPGEIDDTPSNEKEARMYETADENDGYKVLNLYLEKVKPKEQYILQYPKPNVRSEDKVWLEARPLQLT